jgi:hypothetical protein
MSYAKRMLDTYPRDFNLDAGVLTAAIDALSDCAQACTACADEVHPPRSGLCRCVHGHAAGGQPPDRVRRECHPAAAGGVRGGLPELWG